MHSTMRGEPCHRWQNTTLRLSFGYPVPTLKRDSCPMVMGSRSTMSGESSGQKLTSPTTCHQVWSGSVTDGSASIFSHLAMQFWPEMGQGVMRPDFRLSGWASSAHDARNGV